ncbi:MAG: glycosyltransferase [Acidimicrobiia bacterium]
MSPKVSIGLPIYNAGEEFTRAAIETILNQEYEDFEFLISDNGSTDEITVETIEEYAKKDDRIIFIRGRRNLGAQPNYDRLFEQSRGEYFSWKAHDDRFDSKWLGACVDALDSNPKAVLAYTDHIEIDEHGNQLDLNTDYSIDTDNDDPVARFLSLACDPHPCYPLFGLMRSSTLASTNLHGNYVGSDRVLLAEFAANGKFVHIPEKYFLHGEHSLRSVNVHEKEHERRNWFDVNYTKKFDFPNWKYVKEYYKAINRSAMTKEEKRRAIRGMQRWVEDRKADLLRDVLRPVKAGVIAVKEKISN